MGFSTEQATALVAWPLCDLYQVLCDVVRTNGPMPLPGLKQVLQKHGSTDFEKCGLNFVSEDGQVVKLKRREQLVEVALRWRNDHVESAMPKLELAVQESSSGWDWLAVCFVPDELESAPEKCEEFSDDTVSTNFSSDCSSRSSSSGSSTPDITSIPSANPCMVALGDRRSIPTGIVEKLRMRIELSV